METSDRMFVSFAAKKQKKKTTTKNLKILSVIIEQDFISFSYFFLARTLTRLNMISNFLRPGNLTVN